MTKNRKRRVISSLLTVVLTLGSLSGCASQKVQQMELMEIEKSPAISFDIIGGKDVMPIGAYYIPYSSIYSYNGNDLPNYISDEFYAKIADSGINLLMHSVTDYSDAPNLVMKNLDLGAKYNIAVIVDDSTVRNMADLDEISIEKASNQLAKYMNHPAFGGLYLVDEPMTSYFLPADDLARELYRYEDISPLLQYDIGIFCYENALSSSRGDKERDNYEKYLREYCDVLKPTYLSFDRYPYDIEQ